MDLFHAMVNGFSLGTVDLARLNYGAICLIPKVKGAAIKLFRPITLINMSFKLCAKAYATRLAPVAHRVILKSQTAFLKGRNILEGPIVLTEIIHELKRTIGQGVILKLDFEKAYDRINWEFVHEVLLKKGFEAGFVHHIMHLYRVGTPRLYSMAKLGSFSTTKKGYNKGTPSPRLSSTSWRMACRL